MKAKVTAKAKSTEETVIEVPAKLTAWSKTLVEANKGIAALTESRESILEKGSQLLSELYDTREEAKPALALVFKHAGLTDMNSTSQRSRILSWAFPKDEAVFEQIQSADTIKFRNAKGDLVEKKPSVLQKNAAAAGSLRPNKKGIWLPVQSRGNQGGQNRLSPQDAAKKAIEAAATAFIAMGRQPAIAFFNLTIEVLQSVKDWKFDSAEAAELLSED